MDEWLGVEQFKGRCRPAVRADKGATSARGRTAGLSFLHAGVRTFWTPEFPVSTRSPKMRYLFVFLQCQTRKRLPLLLELL